MSGRSAVAAVVAVLLLTPATAHGSTVKVGRFTDPDTGDVYYPLAIEDRRGDANRLSVHYEYDSTHVLVVVRERGRAPLIAGKGCAKRAAQEVRCRGDITSVFVGAGGGRDRVRCDGEAVLIYGEGGADRLMAGGCGSDLVGGPGDDVLVGDRRWQWLVGGGGGDVLRGRGGDDRLKGDGHRSSRGADLLDGGAGSDTASWDERTTGIRVELANGTGPEGDRLRDVEELSGTRGDDVLIGDAGRNRLRGSYGHDRLVGRGGRDTLNGGTDTHEFAEGRDRSRDSFSCGEGRDIVRYPETALIPPSCERMFDFEGLDFFVLPIFPRPAGKRQIEVHAVCDPTIERCRHRAVVSSEGVELGRSRVVESDRFVVWLKVPLDRRLPARARVKIEITGQVYDPFEADEGEDPWFDRVPFVWRVRCRGGPDCRGAR